MDRFFCCALLYCCTIDCTDMVGDGVILALLLFLLQHHRMILYLSYESDSTCLAGLLLSVVVLTRVHVASPRRHTLLLPAACGSFAYRRLPPSGVAPYILLLLPAASGGPGLLVPPARSKSKRKSDVQLPIL